MTPGRIGEDTTERNLVPPADPNPPLVSVRDVTVRFGARRRLRAGSRKSRQTVAARSVNLDIRPGETVGLVGESGSGKTTVGRAVLRLIDPQSGTVLWKGRDLFDISSSEMRGLRSKMQVIMQDPYGSLDPAMKIGEILREPLDVHHIGNKDKREGIVTELLRKVGLDESIKDNYPRECSGGQCQRVNIARAVALKPEFLVADEPTSALDVSIQSQIIRLLLSLQAELGLAMLFISHNLAVVKIMADRVAVMYQGELVELGDVADVYNEALHPYTRVLLRAIPAPGFLEPDHDVIVGETADELSASEPPASGALDVECVFRLRCPFAEDRCATEKPAMRSIAPGHQVACHLAERIALRIAEAENREPGTTAG